MLTEVFHVLKLLPSHINRNNAIYSRDSYVYSVPIELTSLTSKGSLTSIIFKFGVGVVGHKGHLGLVYTETGTPLTLKIILI